MKNFIFAIILSLTVTKTYATEITCKTTKNLYNKSSHSVTFNIYDIDTKNASLDDDEEISVNPAGSPLAAINENWIIKASSKELVITADSDGFYRLQLTLNKKDNYKTGLIKVKDTGEGFGSKSSPVTCILK